MTPFLLADWTTINGAGSVTSLVQSAAQWVELADHEEAVFTIDIADASASVLSMVYQSSPTREEASFASLVTPFAMAAGTKRTDRVLFATAGVPLARFVRWKITSTSTPSWTAAFRIWLVAYSYG